MASHRRDHLVDTALKLFQQEGFRATGIDRVLARAGVAKMTLYNHFRSKQDLILAVLALEDARFWDWLRSEVEARAPDPRGRLLAVFDALGHYMARPEARGSLWLIAAAEFRDADDPVHRAAVHYRAALSDYLLALAAASDMPDPHTLVRQWMLLIDGVLAQSLVGTEASAVAEAKLIAGQLFNVRRLQPSAPPSPPASMPEAQRA